jgi:hypothetical protein
MTVLFGPYWPAVLPLRILGFGALGPIAGTSSHMAPEYTKGKIPISRIKTGSIAAMLQSVLYGGFTPGGGWFASLQRWGMNI